MFETGKKPNDIVEEKGLKQITDTGEIEGIIDEVIQAIPDQVEKAKENPKLIGLVRRSSNAKNRWKSEPWGC